MTVPTKVCWSCRYVISESLISLMHVCVHWPVWRHPARCVGAAGEWSGTQCPVALHCLLLHLLMHENQHSEYNPTKHIHILDKSYRHWKKPKNGEEKISKSNGTDIWPKLPTKEWSPPGSDSVITPLLFAWLWHQNKNQMGSREAFVHPNTSLSRN